MPGFDEALAELIRRLEEGDPAGELLAPALERALDALDAESAGALDLDRAAALLLAGARLLERRARALLPLESAPAPAAEEEDEAPETAEELARRLAEYRGYKEAAALLRRFEEEQARRFPSGAEPVVAGPGAGLGDLTLDHLLAAFQRIWEAAAPEVPGEIPREEVTVEMRMEALLDRLEREGEVAFTALFDGQTTRRLVVVTFLALLELIRLGRLLARQERLFGEIFVSLKPVAA